MSNVHVMLIYGGQSSEHEVSIVGAKNVFNAINRAQYDISLCFIDKEGRWWLCDGFDETADKAELLPVLGQKEFLTIPDHQRIKPDVLLPILHGRHGEDGTVQGLAELLGIPYTGPSVLSAAVTMDKDMTKKLLEYANIPVVPWRTWFVHDRKPDYETIVHELGRDLFVKPASAGSSIGVSHLTSSDQWDDVLNLASDHSTMVLIEKAIKAREIEVSVLGNHDPVVSTPGEINPGADFYSYDDKYDASSSAELTIPADLPAETVKKIQEYAKTAYRATESRGMARVDFFVDQNLNIYLNEINSIPGFTDISMYPKLWDHDGLEYSKLISRIIELALE